jgi:ABC-2 type transport system permease protein
MSFVSSWKRSLACARLAVLSQLEYRFNFFTDAVIQPVLTGGIEVLMWSAIFASAGQTAIGGFPREYYLAYALWAAFFARIGSNWMYEYRMIDEIDTGTVNSVLARPISFYEYYFAQFMGYKVLTGVVSLIVPALICLWIPGPTDLSRLPLAFLLISYYLVLVHTISFMVASSGFFFNRVHSFTIAKNIALWLFSGELFPLDLIPEPYRNWIIKLPFACATYIPVGYLTGRIGLDTVANSFLSITLTLIPLGLMARVLWLAGRRRYSGTGA